MVELNGSFGAIKASLIVDEKSRTWLLWMKTTDHAILTGLTDRIMMI